MIDLHEDLLSYAEAATDAHLPESRIRQWKSRGHLRPAGLDEFGRPLFRLIDVLRAETAAADRLARSQGRRAATRRANSQP